MKRKTMSQAALLIGVALIGVRSIAASLYWDADGNFANNIVDGTGLGGSNTWTTAGLWWDGTSAANQNWVASSDAIFSGTPAGTVMFGAAVSAGTLTFNVSGYTINMSKADNTAAYNLTLTGLSGQNATIRNTCGTAAAALTLAMANDTVWGGIINPASDRIDVTVQGGKSLTVGQCNRNGGGFQQTLNVTGAGTKLALSGTSSSWAGNFVAVQAGATLDVGNSTSMSARRWTLVSGGTITTTGTSGTIHHSSGNDTATYFGSLTGPLQVVFASNSNLGQVGRFSDTANSFTGGTLLSSATAGTCDVRAQANSALGTGRVRMENTSAANISILDISSPSPSIGSLESAGIGSKRVLLGTSVPAVSAGLKATYALNNVVLTLTAGSTASLTVGQPITGASIPAGTVVTTIYNDTQFTISQNPTASQTGVDVSASLMKATWLINTNALTLTAGSTIGLSVGQTITGTGIPVGSVVTAITAGTTFTINQNTTAAGTAATIGMSAVNTTLTVGALSRASDIFGGEIGQALGTTGAVTKVGTGTWTLSGTNKYTGTTRVENGTLALVKKSGFVAGTLKYTSFTGSNVITITTGSASLLMPGQVVTGTGIPGNALVSSIAGNLVTLTVAATAAGTAQNLTAYAMDGSLASGDIDVVGGTLNGSGTIGFRLDSATDGIVMTSGALDLTALAINFTGTPTLKTYTLVDYSAGGSATFATNPGTADSFASAANIPANYKIRHDTTAKLVTLQFISPATMITIF